MTAVVILARFLEFLGATTLFGAPLGFLRGVSVGRRGVAAIAAGLTLAASVAALLCQTAVMAGDPAAAWNGEAIRTVLTSTGFGVATGARIAAALAALLLVAALPSGRRLWLALMALGTVALASLAWSGHGAADEGLGGLVHLGADLVHLIAAGVWLGILAALLLSLYRPQAGLPALRLALEEFSGLGSAVVAALLLSGLVNSWFLVGPQRLGELFSDGYGRLLLLKVALFAGMVALAAANRFRLTPALARHIDGPGAAEAVAALRRSITLETLAGIGVLALVAALGAMAPIAAR